MTRKSVAKNNVVLMLAADYVSLKYKLPIVTRLVHLILATLKQVKDKNT